MYGPGDNRNFVPKPPVVYGPGDNGNQRFPSLQPLHSALLTQYFITGLEGFEPSVYSLEGCRPIQARLQAHTYGGF